MEDIIRFEDLRAVKVLGQGAMGTVFLVIEEKHKMRRALAVKVMSKSAMIRKRGGLRRTEAELDILSSSLQHPFLSSFLGRLETKNIIAFAGEYCPGGDLNNLRHKQLEKTFSDSVISGDCYSFGAPTQPGHSLQRSQTREHPHKASGHIMLTDFDLSTRLSRKNFTNPSETPNPHNHRQANRVLISELRRFMLSCLNPSHCQPGKPQNSTRSPISNNLNSCQGSPINKTGISTSSLPTRSNSFVGTEEYVAPEMLTSNGHEFAVDWWALGILLYEMLYGKTPFKAATKTETFYNILTKQPQFAGPWNPLTDLIIRLLEKEPSKRLSAGGIKTHLFFKGLNWDTVQWISRPPFVPSSHNPLEEMMNSPIDMEEYVEMKSNLQ